MRCLHVYALLVSAALAHAESRLERCSEEHFSQTLDHFRLGREPRTWSQRYYVCDEFWRRSVSYRRPIFFYTGTPCPL